MIKGRFGKMVTGALVISLLAVGLVVLAENGFGGKGSDDWNTAQATGECTQLAERDADGDGIANCDDPDWARPLDGSGYAGCRDTEWACVMEAVQDSRTERGVVR